MTRRSSCCGARRPAASNSLLLAQYTQSSQGALWWHHRREDLPLDTVRASWEGFAVDPIVLYAPEDLMPRAAEITLETGVIIYDALFLALAENSETVVITADSRLLKTLEGTAYTHLAHHLIYVGSIVPDVR